MPLRSDFSGDDRGRIARTVVRSEREQHGPDYGKNRPHSRPNYDRLLKGVLDESLVAGGMAEVSIYVPTVDFDGRTITWAEDDDWTETVCSDDVSEAWDPIPSGTKVTIGLLSEYRDRGHIWCIVNAKC